MRVWRSTVVLLAACAAPTEPYGTELPRALYRDVYEATAECAGLRSRWDEGSLLFFATESDTSWWIPASRTVRRIYLSGPNLEAGNLVRHESLHDLLHSGDHPSPPFGVCDNVRLP